MLEGTLGFPGWSPDDKYGAFADQRGGVVIVFADGDMTLAIPDTISAVSVAWVPVS